MVDGLSGMLAGLEEFASQPQDEFTERYKVLLLNSELFPWGQGDRPYLVDSDGYIWVIPQNICDTTPIQSYPV